MSDRVRHGIHPQLEALADQLIRESLKGVTSHKAKSDILTPWKQQDRHNREVYVASGVPDASNRAGMFHRARNQARPELNSRDGVVRARRGARGSSIGSSSLRSFVEATWDDPERLGETA